MYYVTTETPDYSLTTSYVTEKQARRYSENITAAELHLYCDADGHKSTDMNLVYEKPQIANYEADGEIYDYGKVRTHFISRKDGASKQGKFLLYIPDDDGIWRYSGINFLTYSNANQFLKNVNTFGELLIVENDEVQDPHDLK